MRIGRAARHAVIVGTVLATTLIANAVLAESAAMRQPDGWVRYKAFKGQTGTYPSDAPWKGDDIYNTTGSYQKAKQTAAGAYDPGDHYVFAITLQNDGTSSDRIRVAASVTGDWTVRYFRGTTNITSAVLAGTYQTPLLAGGAAQVIKVKVWVDDAGTSVRHLVTLSSVGNPSKTDAVVVKVNYLGCTC